MEIDENDIRDSFKGEGDNITKGDLNNLKNFASSLLSMIDNQDEETKNTIASAFGNDKLSQLNDLVK